MLGPALPVTAVDAVVVHHRRPRNVVRIVEALREQSLPVTVTVVDAGGLAGPLPADAARAADRVVTLSRNEGPFNRYAALPLLDAPLAWFHDDDLLPGPRAAEGLVAQAAALDADGAGPGWSVLGHHGRRLRADGSYRADPSDAVRRGEVPQVVDVVVHSYLARTAELHHLDLLRRELGLRLPLREDDLLLCCALQRATGRPAVVAARDGWGVDSAVDAVVLPADGALSADAGHLASRDAFLARARAAGWRRLPVVEVVGR